MSESRRLPLPTAETLWILMEDVARAATVDDVHQAAMRRLMHVAGVERSSVRLLDDDGVMRFVAWRGELSEAYRRAAEGHAPRGTGHQDAEPWLVPNVDEEPALAELRPLLHGEGIAAFACVPLRIGSTRLGELVLYFCRPYSMPHSDVVLVRAIAGHVAYAIDRFRVEAAADRLYRATQAAVRMRDEVVAVVSHDIRGPLQTIATACAILGSPGVSPAQRQQALDVIERSVTQMERLATDLLDISRIEAGGLKLELAEVDAAEVAAEVAATLRPTAEAGRVVLEVVVEPGLPRLWADRARLVQVLSNLLINAIKFTPAEGRVVVRMERDPGGVRMAVSDTGCGISPEHMSRLFDRFWQADRKRGAGSGAGLGLAIVKGLVESHGGRVEVHSVVGEGSTFSALIPAAGRSA